MTKTTTSTTTTTTTTTTMTRTLTTTTTTALTTTTSANITIDIGKYTFNIYDEASKSPLLSALLKPISGQSEINTSEVIAKNDITTLQPWEFIDNIDESSFIPEGYYSLKDFVKLHSNNVGDKYENDASEVITEDDITTLQPWEFIDNIDESSFIPEGYYTLEDFVKLHSSNVGDESDDKYDKNFGTIRSWSWVDTR